MDSYQTCAERGKSTHANTIWNQLLQLPKGKEKEKGKGKGKGGKQPPSADVSEAFKAHKLAQQAKRESFKRQMDADLAVRRSKKPKSG